MRLLIVEDDEIAAPPVRELAGVRLDPFRREVYPGSSARLTLKGCDRI